MTASEIVLRQMTRLDEISTATTDSVEICRIAETIGRLGTLLIRPAETAVVRPNEPTPQSDTEPVLSLEQIAEAVGISKYTIRNFVAKDPDFPVIRVDKRLWFRKSAVLAWMAKVENAPTEEYHYKAKEPQRLYQVK